MTGRTVAKGAGLLKTSGETVCMEHISVPAGVFSREKQNRFPQRNESPSAKTKLFCRKAVPAGAERGEKQGFEKLFRPGWSPLACKSRLSFCKPFPRRIDAGAGSGRTAFRDGRQIVAETGSRLSSCIPLGARGSRISVLFPSPARLRGSRRGCLDVLTKCHLEVAAVRRPFGTFATGDGRCHRNRQGSF